MCCFVCGFCFCFERQLLVVMGRTIMAYGGDGENGDGGEERCRTPNPREGVIIDFGAIMRSVLHIMAFMDEFQHLKIHVEEIKLATNNFGDSNLIGTGGFGKVYKGEISHSKGQSMGAIKRLDSRHGQGNSEFWREIMMLSRYTHENLVSLLGYCDEAGEKILVYEHASHGSLDRHLSATTLTWMQRLRICVAAARGLNYLHDPKETHRRVLHRDIKSSNILLDENWNAKRSRDKRPPMVHVVEQLEIALELQEMYELVIVTAVPPLIYKSKEELKLLLSKGILVNGGKTWYSLNKKGEHWAMISAAECIPNASTDPRNRYVYEHNSSCCGAYEHGSTSSKGFPPELL
ncbi:hypothetical protein L6452_32054 [Arctium lappa]|uniref:Uncharacterized protein n=1 Tax=Arctium lappa TaxID=4217 RepID=A0ACB8Z3H5_ARCLA|nr:hypothetical protein L6452_32054 [Arctium lappa]